MRLARIPFVLRLFYPTPSCEISILEGNTLVIVFSVRVINFNEVDIVCVGGTLSNFIGNGRDFCVEVITDTTAEIYVPAGVCRSVNEQPNTESNRLIYNA